MTEIIPKNCRKLVEDHQYFSLDIFDTLVVRACHYPSDVFLLIGRHFECDPEITDFQARRVQAEDIARQLAAQAGRKEITLSEIYDILQKDLGLSDDVRRKMEAMEEDYEVAMCVPSVFGTALLNLLKEKNRRFILASDMYLPERTITAILEKCGISGHEKLMISNVGGKTKHHGDMYDDIIAHFGVPPEKIVHVGDNFFADKMMAAKAGITGYHRPAVRDIFQTDEIWTSTGLFQGTSSFKMIFNALYAEQYSSPNGCLDHLVSSEEAYWKSFGWLRLAPLTLSLCLWIEKTRHQQNIRQIAFLARDGAFPKRAYDLLFPDRDVQTTYCAASRRFLTIPNTVLSPKELEDFFVHLRGKNGSRQDFLDALPGGEEIASRLKAHGFDLDCPLSKDRAGFFNAIGENAGLISNSLQGNRIQASNYLRDTLNLSEKVAIFDLGWRGSLQASIETMLPEHADNIAGLYFGTTYDSLDILLKRGSNYFSYSMANGRPEFWRDACQSNTDVIEFLFSADHGSVEAVGKDEGEYRWITSSVSQAEAESQKIAKLIQDGAIEALEHVTSQIPMDFLEEIGRKNLDATDFFNFLFSPNPEDARRFSEIRVFSGIGDQIGTPLASRTLGRLVSTRFHKARWRAAVIATLSKADRRILKLMLVVYHKSHTARSLWQRLMHR